MSPGEGRSHPSERRAILAQDVAVAASAGPRALGELFRNLRWVVSSLLGNTPEDVEAALASLPDPDILRLREGLRLSAPFMRSLEPPVAVMNTLLSRLSEYPELAGMTAAYERGLSVPYLKNAWPLPDLVRGPVLHSWHVRAVKISLCAFSRDGSLLAAGDTDGVLTVWDARTGWHLHHLEHSPRTVDGFRWNPPRGVTACAFGPDGRVVVGYHDGVLRVWDLSPALDSGPSEDLVHVFEDAGRAEVHAVGIHVTDTGRTVLVSTHEGGEVRVRDWGSGQLLYVRGEPDSAALGVPPHARVSQDGAWLALLDRSGRVDVWRLSTGAHHVTLTGDIPTCQIIFGDDGRLLCLHDAAGRLTVHDMADGRRLSHFTGARSAAVRVPGSDRLAFATRRGRLRVVSMTARSDSAIIRALAGLRRRIREAYENHVADNVYRLRKGLAVAPPGRARYWTRGTVRRAPSLFPDGTGRWIAGVREYEFRNRVGGLSYVHKISFHDALSGRRLSRTTVPNECFSAAAAPDGAWLAAFTEGAVTFWGPDATARAGLTLDETSRLTATAGHASEGAGLLMALGWEGGDVRLIDPARPIAAAGRGGAHGPAMKCAVDPRRTRVAVSCRDRAVELLDAGTGAVLRTFTGRTYGHFLNFVGPTTALAPDHTWVATTDDDFTVRVWDTRTGREQAVLPQAGSPLGAGTSRTGPWLVTESQDGAVSSWDPRRGRLTHQLSAPRGSRVGFGLTDPQGRWIAVRADRGQFGIWDPAAGRLLRTLGGPEVRVGTPLVASPDGRLLLMGHDDGSATVHDLRTGGSRASGRYSAEVTAGAIRSDGLVVTADRKGRVSTWNPATGMLRHSRLTCGAPVSSCRFSPDGAWISTTDDAGTLRVWSTTPLKGRTGIRTTGALRDCAWVSDRLLCAVGDSGSYLFHWRPQTPASHDRTRTEQRTGTGWIGGNDE